MNRYNYHIGVLAKKKFGLEKYVVIKTCRVDSNIKIISKYSIRNAWRGQSKWVENLFKLTTIFECLSDAVFGRKDNTILSHKTYTIIHISCTIYMVCIKLMYIYIYNGLVKEQQ